MLGCGKEVASFFFGGCVGYEYSTVRELSQFLQIVVGLVVLAFEVLGSLERQLLKCK